MADTEEKIREFLTTHPALDQAEAITLPPRR